MLCCAIAAIGLAGAWMAHRLRLIGGLALLAAAAVAGGSVWWDHRNHGAMAAHASPEGVSLCSSNRTQPEPPYPKL